MKQYNLTITENQAKLLVKALDFYSRIGMGQFEELVRLLSDERCNNFGIANDLMYVVKSVLFGKNHFGIMSKELPDNFRIAWDIRKVIEHQFWKENPIRRCSVDVDAPKQFSKEPLPIIKKYENKRTPKIVK